MHKETALALFLAASFWGTAAGNAQDLGQRGQFWGVRSGNTVIAARPPYFALHPPVYYDRIVPRSYGISPFAVPPGIMPVENSATVPPKAVSNPFFRSKDGVLQHSTIGAQARSKSYPPIMGRKIVNPFYAGKVVANP